MLRGKKYVAVLVVLGYEEMPLPEREAETESRCAFENKAKAFVCWGCLLTASEI